jgi:methyl-accepting chemotaxis protein
MQLDELTQQNAALVEQASAASQAMAEQARGLNDSMQRYQVNGQPLVGQTGTASAAHDLASERRKPSRPWVVQKPGKRDTGSKRSAAVAPAAADDVWKEF